jgi:uncharacterized membrane protein
MDKREFLARLEAGLRGLPPEDLAEHLSFYEEMIEDRMEDGLTEAEAVAGIGPVEDIVQQIVAETPLRKIVRERMRPERKMRGWEIVLLALGSPIWLSLLISAFAVLLSVYVVIWSVIVSLWAVDLALLVSSAAGVLAGVVLICKGSVLTGLAAIGAGLMCLGLSIFLFYGCLAATKGAAMLTKKIALWIKSLFLRKEAAK